jgi:hypothetical protein
LIAFLGESTKMIIASKSGQFFSPQDVLVMLDTLHKLDTKIVNSEASEVVAQDVALTSNEHYQCRNQSVQTEIGRGEAPNAHHLVQIRQFVFRRSFGTERVPTCERQLLLVVKKRSGTPGGQTRSHGDHKCAAHSLPEGQIWLD